MFLYTCTVLYCIFHSEMSKFGLVRYSRAVRETIWTQVEVMTT